MAKPETIEIVDRPNLILGRNFMVFLPSSFVDPTWQLRHPRMFVFKKSEDIKRLAQAVLGIKKNRSPKYGTKITGIYGKRVGEITVCKAYDTALRMFFESNRSVIASVDFNEAERDYLHDALKFMYAREKKREDKTQRKAIALLTSAFEG